MKPLSKPIRFPVRQFLLLMYVLALVFSWSATASETIFQMGYPDGRSGEFRKTIKWEDYYGKTDPVCVFEIGKSQAREWFAWHNSTREWHAAGHSFTGVIKFTAQRDYNIPLYLVIGTCYGHATEPSLINVTVNGTAVDPVRVKPGPPKFPKFNAAGGDGWPETNVVPIPAGLVRKGDNSIGIKLTDGSWSIYDYLVLKDTPEGLPIVPVEKMLDQFRAPGGPMSDVNEILFAVRKPSFDGHWYANFGYYACDTGTHPFPLGEGGQLRILNLQTGEARVIFEDKQGNVRDPQVHYDGTKAIFSYLKAGTGHYRLYEINLDGTGLRQITSDCDYDDIEPAYLPNGDIVFCSSRAKRWVQCWLTGVATLHRCGPNGENIRPISSNPEQENTPWVLPNGQILYMRWEYIDRSQVHYHHLWTSNPDGTKHQAYFGNQHPGICMLGAKPVRVRSQEEAESLRYPVVATFSPGHGRREHYGAITLVDPRNGPDDMGSTLRISLHNDHADPWAFSESCFMAVRQTRLQVMDVDGREADIYTLPQEDIDAGFWVADPQPIITRDRETVIADVTNDELDYGYVAMANVNAGRRLKDLPAGTVKQLLILEPLPIPVHYNGGMMSVSSGGTFSMSRIIGTVPVNDDGSVFMELPAKRSLQFVALDAENKPVKRMHSFMTVMPGENAICIGCHEQRTEAPTAENRLQLMKVMSRPATRPTPIDDVPEVFDFMRDIRPIIDKYCLECHNEARPEGNWDLNSDLRTTSFVRSYSNLSYRDSGMLGDNRNRPMSDFAPYEIGSCASKLYQLIQAGHPDKDGKVRVQMTEADKKMVRLWLEVGAPYAGTYAANACGLITWSYSPYGADRRENGQLVREDLDWPECKVMAEAINRRCARCHSADKHGELPKALSHNTPKFAPGWSVNLSFPEKSRLVMAPLAKAAGGNQRCWSKDEKGNRIPEIVFQSTDDPDYKAILGCIERGKHFVTSERSHFSIKPFYPNPWYVREMIRYGVLPADYKEGTPIDPYETDQKYWELLRQ